MKRDFRHFLRTAQEAGPDFYVEAKRPVDPYFEVCVLQQKLTKAGRPPIIYCPETVGTKLPLVTNIYGSYDMLGLIMGMDSKKQAMSF